MILQTADWLNKNINRWGCLWFVWLSYGSQYGGHAYKPEDFEFLYKWHVDQGWMKDDCWIVDPDKILKDLGVDMPGWVSEVDLDYEMPPTKGRVLEALKYERPGYGHWVRGNGHRVITFDPIGRCKTVAEGELVRRVLAFE